MAWQGLRLTLAGRSMLAAALDKSTSISFTRLVYGDGRYEGALENATDVVSAVYTDSALSVSSHGDTLYVEGLFTNKDFTIGKYIREKGLYAKIDGTEGDVLMAYDYSGEDADYYAAGDSSQVYEFVSRILMQITDLSNVSITINGGALLSRYEFDEHVRAHNPHNITVEMLGAAKAVHTHMTADVAGLDETLAGKAAATIPMTVVAPASAWAMVDAGYYTQTLTVGIMTANSNAIVGLSDTATAAQARECRWAKIRPMAQGAGTLTLAADGSRPEVDLPVSIMIIG